VEAAVAGFDDRGGKFCLRGELHEALALRPAEQSATDRVARSLTRPPEEVSGCHERRGERLVRLRRCRRDRSRQATQCPLGGSGRGSCRSVIRTAGSHPVAQPDRTSAARGLPRRSSITTTREPPISARRSPDRVVEVAEHALVAGAAHSNGRSSTSHRVKPLDRVPKNSSYGRPSTASPSVRSWCGARSGGSRSARSTAPSWACFERRAAPFDSVPERGSSRFAPPPPRSSDRSPGAGRERLTAPDFSRSRTSRSVDKFRLQSVDLGREFVLPVVGYLVAVGRESVAFRLQRPLPPWRLRVRLRVSTRSSTCSLALRSRRALRDGRPVRPISSVERGSGTGHRAWRPSRCLRPAGTFER